MKTLSRQYFWWPKLDGDIEEFVKSCKLCRILARKPEKTIFKKFKEPKSVKKRMHIDFLGPFKEKV